MGGLVRAGVRRRRGRALTAFRSVAAAAAFYAAPAALVAAAVSVRSAGIVEPHEAVQVRMAPFVPAARAAAAAEGVPVELILAVASAESGGRPAAVSGRSARGLMQILPETAAELTASAGEPPAVLTDPATSLRLGARYLRWQLDAHAGHAAQEELALCAYNAGPGTVRGWLAETPVAADRAHLGDWIRFRETRVYVQRVAVWRRRWAASLAASR